MNNHCWVNKWVTAFIIMILPLPMLAHAQIQVGEDGSVGIGQPPGGGKLSVRIEDGNGYLHGIESWAENSNYVGRGLFGGATNSSYYSIGVWGEAEGSYKSFGVYGYANSSMSNQIFGLYGEVNGWSSETTSYGVYGKSSGSNIMQYAGYFSGDVHVTGSLTTPSDSLLKTEIHPLVSESETSIDSLRSPFEAMSGKMEKQHDNADATSTTDSPKDKLLKLQPHSFEYRTNEHPGLGLPRGKQYGLLAQHVEAVFPELVNNEMHPGETRLDGSAEVTDQGSTRTYKSVNYMQLIPLLLQTVREQQAEIDTLRTELEALKEAVQNQGISVE